MAGGTGGIGSGISAVRVVIVVGEIKFRDSSDVVGEVEE